MKKYYTPWQQTPAYGSLIKLAANPYDLTRPGALSAERIRSSRMQVCGFDLLYATQRVDDQVIDQLQQLADQRLVLEQFLRMKEGAVLNRIEGFESENRPVLHTACRDIFSEKPRNPEATGQARKELDKLRAFLEELDTGKLTGSQGVPFTDLISIGIGGSDLGPRAIYLALAAYARKGRGVHFISNVDPDDAAAVLGGLDLSRTLVCVVSKSGSTLETLTNEELVRAAYLKAGLKPESHFLAVTGENSPMDNPQRYLRSFYMFDYIGGRYSATSMVGGVLLSFSLDFDTFTEILRGANSMDIAAEEPDLRKNPCLMLAMLGIWNHNFLGMETLAVLPYSQALLRFPAHLQQCDMESNGKSITRTGEALEGRSGPVVWGEPGTNGQHAFYQLIHQGTIVVPSEFIVFRQSQRKFDMTVKDTTSQQKLAANALAQSQALAVGRQNPNPNKRFAGNRPSSILIADRLTPFSMGALLSLYENKIVMQGFVWNINSFDQEGVQLGKELANRLLDHLAARKKDPSYDGARQDPAGWEMLRTAGLL
jgi:glucose-6-phosphate isomerase